MDNGRQMKTAVGPVTPSRQETRGWTKEWLAKGMVDERSWMWMWMWMWMYSVRRKHDGRWLVSLSFAVDRWAVMVPLQDEHWTIEAGSLQDLSCSRSSQKGKLGDGR